MAPPRGTIGDRRAVRGSSDVRTLRARTAGCTLGAMCFLLLMALAALVASSTITRAEAQWWRALGALLRDTEEAAPALRPAHKTVPEGVIALPKAAEAPPAAKPEVPSPSLAAPLSAAMQAAARSASRCFSSGDAKSQLDCRRLIWITKTFLTTIGSALPRAAYRKMECRSLVMRGLRVVTSM